MNNPAHWKVAYRHCCFAFPPAEPDLTVALVKDRFQQEGLRQQNNDFPGVCACGFGGGGGISPAATHCDTNNLSMVLASPCKTARIRHCPSSSLLSLQQIQAHHARSARNEMNIQILRVNICRWALFRALILKAAVTL